MSKSNKTLSLIDLRGFIHTGVVKSNVLVSSPSYDGNVAKVNSLSAGGTAYLLSFILKNLSKTDIIVATDSAYSVRRDRYSGYKATRRKKYSLNREERETWAAKLAGSEGIWISGIDFDGHVWIREYTSL